MRDVYRKMLQTPDRRDQESDAGEESVERDRPCTFRCYLRQEGVKGPVEVRLHREGKLLASAEFSPGGAWKRYSARLSAVATWRNWPGKFW